MTLNEVKIGQTVVITAVGGEGRLRQHFLDMGIIPEAKVKLMKYAPMGDPMQLQIHGYELTLRIADATKISVRPATNEDLAQPIPEPTKDSEHPGFGEEGYRFHDPATEHPLPKNTKLTFALAGNQNCGKTTLFNQLTGANQHVGNFPGVTVDHKSGQIKDYPDTIVTDLPGIYSLSPYTSEEIVSRQYILDEKPKGIINIVDATNIERNLYLTMQLLELNIPMVLALNMMDELDNNGGTVRVNEMEQLLGIPVIPISAAHNAGVDELVSHAIHIARYQEGPQRQDFCDPHENNGALHRCIHAIMHLIEDHAQAAEIPIRFAASKLIEGDELVLKALQLDKNEQETLEHIITQMETERGLDRSAAIADMRFDFIQRLCNKTVVKPQESKEHRRSIAVDKILTGKYTAIPTFLAIMAVIFYITFEGLGGWLQDLMDEGIEAFTQLTAQAFENWNVSAPVTSLVIDGVFAGIGSVLSFLPIIIILFFFLSMLEDSGYMARIAFVSDKMLRKTGLSGRSIVPMLIGFGCSVPSVMASRTLPSERDRKLTILLTPFMSCTAKLPIYAFFIDYFFPTYSWLLIIALYLTGILVGICVALIAKRTIYKGEAVPFVMELPNYRLPGAKNVILLLWDKAKDFLQKAFTVIFVASMVIWFLQNFDFRLSMVDADSSMLAIIAGIIAPIFTPLGFSDWRIVTALATGFMAKESVRSTLEQLYESVDITTTLTTASAAALLVFCLLYTPCVAAIAAIRRELGNKYAWFTVVLQCSVAWIIAFVVKAIIELFC
ncbi:MAG: ferrous iron transport protein B [Bacteroidales bacterium]|nr:ferrous iron transport protein B [Bacteroidales bacterium]